MSKLLKNPDTKLIIEVVKKHTSYSYKDLNIKSRKRPLAQARFLIMHLHLIHTKNSPKDIGGLFGKDYSIVYYADKTIQNLMFTDREFRKVTKLIEKDIINNLKAIEEESTKTSSPKKEHSMLTI